MVTVRDCIIKAARKLGLIRAGGTVTDAVATDFLGSLVSQYDEWINQGTFGRVRSMIQTVDATAGLNQHLNNLTTDSLTVALPDSVNYWWAEAIVPFDLSVVKVTNLTDKRKTYLYDKTIQRWVDLSSLALEDEAPLSSRGADGLAAILTMRMADEYGSELLQPSTLRQANAFKLALVSRYGVDEQEPCYVPYDYQYSRG